MVIDVQRIRKRVGRRKPKLSEVLRDVLRRLTKVGASGKPGIRKRIRTTLIMY